MTAAKKRRWSFRARFTALIAVVFVTGGFALLGVQYLLVQGLFDTAIAGLVGCREGNGVTVTTGDDAPAEATCTPLPAATATPDVPEATGSPDVPGITVEQTTMLSQEVLSGLLLWSIATLLLFAVVAVVAASWLSGRSFARIGQIADTTRRITGHGLHQRLDLPGPADEIKELGDTIDMMLDGLEAAFTRQERFITNASHELRTPLTTTRTALEIPLEQGRVPEQLVPSIRRALDANRRSEQLIASLLQLARTTAFVPETGQKPVDLAIIVEQSLTERHDDITAADLRLTTNLSDAAVRSADLMLLTLAIDNLIDNAIRHNHPGGTLQVTTDTAGGETWVEVMNTGTVYAAEEVARLTEPFDRGHNTRTPGSGRGLGLGLALVHNITESLGATLALTPLPAGGLVARATFRGDR